jgi:hypothetical protein
MKSLSSERNMGANNKVGCKTKNLGQFSKEVRMPTKIIWWWIFGEFDSTPG